MKPKLFKKESPCGVSKYKKTGTVKTAAYREGS
jgi:hypothetical protein